MKLILTYVIQYNLTWCSLRFIICGQIVQRFVRTVQRSVQIVQRSVQTVHRFVQTVQIVPCENRSVRESFRAEATPLQTFRPFKPRPVTFTVRTSHIAMASEKGGRKLTNKIKSVILNLKKVGLSTVKIQQIIEKQYVILHYKERQLQV